MAKKGRMGVLKRQREVRKREKAALKRDKRQRRLDSDPLTSDVPSQEELAAYGFEVEPGSEPS